MFLIKTLKISSNSLSFIFKFFVLLSNFKGGFVLVSSGLNVNDAIEYLPVSGLCENSSLSCSHQTSYNLSDDACQMIYRPKKYSDCESSRILIGDFDESEEFSNMVLSTYYLRERSTFPKTAFNVSFSNIEKNTTIYMRFIENQSKLPSLCREFKVFETAPLSFFFDCLWAKSYNHSSFYHFDYKAILPSGNVYIYKYIFFIPKVEDIAPSKLNVSTWDIFTYVDLSGSPYRLVLRIQLPPKELGIHGYKIELMKTLEQNTWVVKFQNVVPEENATEIRYVFDTDLNFGKYKFHITPLHPNCTSKSKCRTSKTPEILIVEMTDPKVLTAIVVTVILIPIILMAYFIWKRQCDTTKDQLSEPHTPRFLMLYKPVSVEHIEVMIELYKYFTKDCHVHAMLDQFGIPESVHKDPVDWYSEAFNLADFVGIFASPETPQGVKREDVFRYNRYLNTEVIAENQLKQVLCKPGAKCKFFAILLPGTKWETLPTQAQALKRKFKTKTNFISALASKLLCTQWESVPDEYDGYILPRDLDPLLVLIGVTPQCDGGKGFTAAMSNALSPPTPETTANLPQLSEPLPTTSEELVLEEQRSLCCNTHSGSDLDLVSSRQYLSDMSTTSSIEHLSLCGESN